MQTETKLMALVVFFALASTLIFIFLLRATDHYETRELAVKEYCIEKGLRPKFCEKLFKD